MDIGYEKQGLVAQGRYCNIGPKVLKSKPKKILNFYKCLYFLMTHDFTHDIKNLEKQKTLILLVLWSSQLFIFL